METRHIANQCNLHRVLTPIPAATQTDNPQPFKVEITGSGHPILLIPGLSSSGDVWRETVSRYQNSFECHIFTLAGFAGQPPVRTDHYLQTMRDALIAYIQKNNLTKTNYCRTQFGWFSIIVGCCEHTRKRGIAYYSRCRALFTRITKPGGNR